MLNEPVTKQPINIYVVDNDRISTSYQCGADEVFDLWYKRCAKIMWNGY